jgi:H/ACA ribonucleoprotein complex subunit 3
MKHLIRKCTACGGYTLASKCPKCGAQSLDPHPPKYSPDDKYVRYRVAERYEDEKGEAEEGDKDYK